MNEIIFYFGMYAVLFGTTFTVDMCSSRLRAKVGLVTFQSRLFALATVSLVLMTAFATVGIFIYTIVKMVEIL